MIGEKLMPIAWPSKRWWDWCVSEGEKKKWIQFLLKSFKSVWR